MPKRYSLLNQKYRWADYNLTEFDPGKSMAGWYGIMDTFLKCVEERCADQYLDPADDGVFHFWQIKEKWGSLNIYCSSISTVETFDLCMMAEASSMSVCMFCGAPGRLRSGAWHVTLCDRCQSKRQLYIDDSS